MVQKPTYEELEQRIKNLEDKSIPQNNSKRQSVNTEAIYRLMLENISDTVILTDDIGNMLYVCPNTANIFGSSQEEIYAQQTIQRFMNGSLCDISEIKKKGEIENIERSIKNLSGEERFLSINVKSVNINGGTILYVMHDVTDLLQTKAALSKNRAHLKAALDSMPDAVFISDTDSNFIEFNSSFATFHKFKSKDECLKTLPEWHNLLEVNRLDGSLVPLDLWVVPRALRGETGLNEEFVLHRIDTGEKWIGSYNFSPIRKEDGSIIGSVVVGRDITAQKHVEMSLKESEDKFKNVFEHSVIGKSITHVSGEMHANRAFCEMLGYSQDEFDQYKWADITHPDDVELSQKVVDSILSGQKSSGRFIKRYIHKDGSVVWGDVSTTLQRDERGNPLYLIASISDITDRKQAEKELEESEEKYRLLFENASQGIGYWTTDAKVISFNKIATEDMQGSPNEFVGKSAIELFGNEQGAVFTDRIKKVTKSNQQQNYEDTVVLASGEKTFLTSYNAISNNSGEILGVQIISTEITERNKLQKNLKKSEERFELAMEAAQDGLYDWNLVANEIYYSPGWKHMLGYKVDELPNDFSVWEELTEPEDIRRAWEMQQDLIEKKRDRFELEFKMRHKNGHWVDILSRAKAIFDDTGKAVRIVGTHVDISERKRAAQETADTVAMLYRAEKMAKLGSWSWDPSTNRVMWSDNMCRLYGIEPSEFDPTYDYANHFTHPDDLEKINKFTQSLVIEKKPLTPFEYRIVTPAGQVKWVIGTNHILFDNKGEIKEVVGTTQDITDRKKMEDQIQQSQKMESIGNLAGGIAHDFNNILSSIIGFTELALQAAPKGSDQRDDLEEVYIAGNRAKELVQQILAFARQAEEETKPVRVSDVVTEALKLLRPSTPTNIQIKPTISSTAKVMGNTSQLHQVVMNLCTNAIHTLQKEGGLLEIGLRNTFVAYDSELKTLELPAGEYVELTVTDNGSGIDSAIIDKIFDPYFTTKGVGEGTGMGLAMVRGIIESYGGDIAVKSEHGKMTTFIIRLPVATGRSYEAIVQADSVGSGTEHILFVDDEPPIARMGSRMLESLGYTVTVRTNSLEALELFRQKPDAFDLVITDMTMPSMTGDVLSIELRKIRQDIPVILCTGYSNKINDKGAKVIGIDAFAYKPFTKSDFAKTIREVLVKKRTSSD